MTTRVYIAIAEPSLIIRSGIIAILKQLPSLHIDVCEITDASYLPVQCARRNPDILIVNPSFMGIMAFPSLKNGISSGEIKCIALQTALTDQSSLKVFDDMISIYDTMEQISEKMTRLCVQASDPSGAKQGLSLREKEVVVCVVKGMTNKQMAEYLCLSTHTIITHRRNIANKLQIHSPAGLTIYALVNKLIELNDVKDNYIPDDETG
ncbi:MAG: LuxR C-terminal-related transcriptional regulator [Tannerella sp.]|jgi:DNA-binding NarL/FixJ family response regulator|nr:LuxR C-terminal-related transcriptional regulator [Tannerella sp.]